MSDLSSFGGGVDHDPSKEDEIRITLSRWLRNAGADVYWDRDHSYGWGTFDPGTAARPDLLVDGPRFTYALEVKPSENSRIHDALPQIHDYWLQVINGESKYTVSGQKKEIDAFLLATDNSPAGRLFDAKGENDVMGTGEFSEGHQKAVQVGQLPQREYNRTESITRALWRYSKNANPNAKLGIGVLLSSRLDGDNPGVNDAYPAALFKSHSGMPLGNSSKTRYQWWEYIPFYNKK